MANYNLILLNSKSNGFSIKLIYFMLPISYLLILQMANFLEGTSPENQSVTSSILAETQLLTEIGENLSDTSTPKLLPLAEDSTAEGAEESTTINTSTTTMAPAEITIESSTEEHSDLQGNTESSSVPDNSTSAPTTKAPTIVSCADVNYCLNGGTCVLNESGQMLCLCPEEFYGSRCQTRNICKTIIHDSMTGDQVCEKIGRRCWKNDKFFRCSCNEDEYFIFKANESISQDQQANFYSRSRFAYRNLKISTKEASEDNITPPPFVYDSLINSEGNADGSPTPEDILAQQLGKTTTTKLASYIAECKKIDKCLGVRCKQLSEVCHEGACVCNNNAGYIEDPSDHKCKLMNPCSIPTEDGAPTCGEAQCIPTYDQELYKCICPLGYQALKVGLHRNSTVCTVLWNLICKVPLLNKCQHICEVDSSKNKYKCSCLRGYRPGNRVGIDDHMCFFIEQVDQLNFDYTEQERDNNPPPYLFRSTESPSDFNDYIFRPYQLPKPSQTKNVADKILNNTFTYDTLTTTTTTTLDDALFPEISSLNDMDAKDIPAKLKSDEIYIKREHRSIIQRDNNLNNHISTRNSNNSHSADDSSSSFAASNSLSKLTAQERCNMYCEENKICELEKGSTDSYRCVCNRQGYVSVGDRCLDWCAAADFRWQLRGLLDYTCLSGVCKPSIKPQLSDDTKLERESSWRPTFECDCSNSPLLVQDKTSKLCKLNFQAALEPCKPGNVGYIDCVEHKNAYCAVLYKQHRQFISELQRDRFVKTANLNPSEMKNLKETGGPNISKNSSPNAGSGGAAINKKNNKIVDKLYTCVCSPEKKFLVDKPRNKERCVDECDLLNIECGRFNRMCRPATIAPDDFGPKNLVRLDPDGARLNFKRTGCECLPGFNVGPSESVDFTIDDNYQPNGALSTSSFTLNGKPPLIVSTNDANYEESEHSRAKYININSRCLLDYDVVEFHAGFKAPVDFDPNWIKINNAFQSDLKSINPETRSVDNKMNMQAQQQDTTTPGKPSQEDKQNSTCTDCILTIPEFMKIDISELHKSIVLVAQCDPGLLPLSIEAFEECTRYRYWIIQKMRNHFIDWRRIMMAHLKESFDLMDGNIRLRINKCEATLNSIKNPKIPPPSTNSNNQAGDKGNNTPNLLKYLDPMDQEAVVDADIDCELTLHSASDETSPRYARKVLLEKQLQKFIFVKPTEKFGKGYYLMAPNMLIKRESFDQLAKHRKEFNPCKSDYPYCEKQTRCEMVDTVNFTCTCEYGYTPIGSRDIYYADSRKEVCEDINECLFDVCKELANVSTCINVIGDYRCQCNRHYIGDNKRYCKHVCNTISCKHGKCRLVDDHHAFCECDEGYKETDCSVQDPNVALRKANMIICGSIFTSVLLLAITFAISLNSQLKKTKKKLKQLEAANEAVRLFEYTNQQPFRPRLSKVSVNS